MTLYSKTNYILIALSLALILLGFFLMSGGSSTDPQVFNEEIFSPRRIRWAPLVCVSGFLLMIFAILYQSKASKHKA